MDAKQKFYLFKQSKNFCAVPWNYIKISMDGTVSTCVMGSEILGNIHDTPIKEIIKNPILTRIRDNLHNDRPDKNCHDCVQNENNVGVEYSFLRGLYNPMFAKSPADYSDSSDFKLAGIDLHWGSTCNLKCITCWAQQSSAIAQEQGLPILSVTSAAADSVIEFVVENQYNLREIYLSGGEPTLIKHNLRLLQRLDKNIECEIRVNTNMMFELENPIIQELKKFPNVLFTISADTSDPERFNYIRRGADWDKFIKNLSELRKLHFKWRINSVFFVATATTLAQTQEYFINEFGIDNFTINQVYLDHDDLRPRNLSAELKEVVKISLLAHREKYKSNTNLFGQLTNCLAELEYEATDNFVGYFNKVDAIAGTDWRKVFTELV
jgi:radical SAM protein with 4Fe4S-binding SPASM domain